MPNNIDGNKFDITGGNLMFAGTSTEIGLDSYNRDNLALYSTNGDISGIRNVIVRGTDITFNTGSKDNVLLAGNGVTFSKEATGSVAIKDNISTTAMTVTNDNTLNIQFNSGTYFNGGNVYVGNSISVQSTGTFSGSLRCVGTSFFSGVSEFGGSSAQSTSFHNTARFKTGFAIPIWSGNGSQAGTSAAPATGALAISGNKLLIYTGNQNVQGWGFIGIGTSP